MLSQFGNGLRSVATLSYKNSLIMGSRRNKHACVTNNPDCLYEQLLTPRLALFEKAVFFNQKLWELQKCILSIVLLPNSEA